MSTLQHTCITLDEQCGGILWFYVLCCFFSKRLNPVTATPFSSETPAAPCGLKNFTWHSTCGWTEFFQFEENYSFKKSNRFLLRCLFLFIIFVVKHYCWLTNCNQISVSAPKIHYEDIIGPAKLFNVITSWEMFLHWYNCNFYNSFWTTRLQLDKLMNTKSDLVLKCNHLEQVLFFRHFFWLSHSLSIS